MAGREARWTSHTLSFALFIGLITPFAALAGGKRVVLLPANVEDVPPEYLADGTQVIDGVLARELDRRGVSYEQLTLVEALRRWTRATEDVGGLVVELRGVSETSLERAHSHFISALLREYEASAVVWPDVVVRKAKKRRRRLAWDGVEVPIPSYKSGAQSPGRGSSLRVRVFDADARVVSDRYYGLEVIDFLKVLRRDFSSRTLWYVYSVRSDLFERAGVLERAAREAIPETLP